MKRVLITAALFVAVGVLIAAMGTSQDAVKNSLVLPSRLVEVSYVSENLDAGNLIFLDIGRKIEVYNTGHIKGALYADQKEYYQTVNGIPGMFPGVEPTVEWLEELGISNDTAVILYDGGNGLWASRVAWTLAYLGHENWAVLNGGYAAWVDSGNELSTEIPSKPVRGTFIPYVQEQLLVDGDTILQNLETPGYVVIDTRSSGEYEGSDVRANRGGHIPGALSIEWVLNNTDGSIPEFLGSEELSEFYTFRGASPDKTIVTHCQTGVRGAHTWLALKLAGFENVALYDGSWIEWSNDEKYPVER